MDEDILIVVPTPEELWIVGHRNQDLWKCPEMGCSYVALNACILGLHKSQVHNFRTKHRKGAANVHYHCPVTNCYFNQKSVRYFKNFDTLRTHYMKLHSEKRFTCTKCSKTFGLERDCHRHETECGQDFSCLDCGKTYTNRSALRRHCDYNRHKSQMQNQETKAKAVKAPRPKPKEVLKKVKGKPPAVTKNTLPFILPKTSQMNSLHIQTDVSGSQLFITKMASDTSTSQAVQTVHKVSMTKSAGIQTTFNFQTRSSEASSQAERLSTGIQTALPNVIRFHNNLCVAQTQTGASMLQTAKSKANIPALNVCKGTQKSPGGTKRMKKSNTRRFLPLGSSTEVSRDHVVYTDSSRLVLNKTVISPDREVQTGLQGNMNFFMSTMSTQTNLSCVSEQILYNSESGIQLQDCHTQTHSNVVQYDQATSLYLDQNILPSCFVPPNSDQVTQTNSYFSIDQNTQTGNMNILCSNNVPSSCVPIQDNQTQTMHNPLTSGIIKNIHTQTQVSGITNVALVQDQGTTCEGLFILNKDMSNLSKAEQNLGNESGIAFLLGHTKGSAEKCLGSEPTNDLIDLMEVIESDMSHMINSCSPSVEDTTSDTSRKTSTEQRNCKTLIEKISIPAASMETQTFEILGMDSMTQTIEDLGWDMGTQTIDYLPIDMMTQTGDDFFEFLTNDTHTQTLSDFCMELESEEHSRIPDSSRVSALDNLNQNNFQGLFGDRVSTQTNCDTEDQTLDFNSSFATLTDTSFRNAVEDSGTQWNASKFFNSYKDNCTGKWESSLSSDIQRTNSEFGRVTETTETQTIYDPLFYNLESEDTLSFNSTKQVKYLESAQTQTTQDPMLPSIVSDYDHVSFFSHSIFSRKETSETQTGTDYLFLAGRETTQSQTSWDNYLNSMGTSETQTQNADFFEVSCSDIQTQTILDPDQMASLDFTNSFTQTNIDQNTQTCNIFDF